MARERTRFKCNSKPVYRNASGTLDYWTKDGHWCEQSGMSPLVALYEKEDVFDETGWNIRYIRPGSVAAQLCDKKDTPADLAVFRESRANSLAGEAMRKHLKL